MKKYLSLVLLIATTMVAAAAPQTLEAPMRTRKTRKPASPPPVTREPVQGVIPRIARSGNPLQMVNPRAPARYGTAAESTSFDPNVPAKWKGIKLFEFLF